MKIIIAGAGEVGLHLSKLLSFESHDITLIDNNDVNLKDDYFTFFWDGSEETAKYINVKKGNSVRFQWEDDEEEGNDYYFEMAIKIDDLTKEVALIVTDFAEEDEVDESKLLWDNNISKLKQAIGG